ncbi:MAG: HAMP domain-containing sensor histidine kinase [Candidatus Gastranaerophilaceae bacterium]|nr:HAMP domain-containing sensor histidine kinase [Candidatus Gastranaerophilaceae bacterium]
MSENSTIQQQARHIGHEIRNQLSICDIYSEIIKKHLIKENINNPSIDNALACIQNAVKLIGNNLIDLKSLDNIILHVCDSKKLLSACVEMAKVYVQDKNIEIKVDLADEVKIYVDENKLQGCVINILKNAIEAVEDKGILSINSVVAGDFLQVSISNTGKPIPKNIKDSIFEDGFTTKESGSGVGLCLCKKYMEQMNCQISLSRSDESCTTFDILIPIIV